jgi:hypothetical protein
MCLRVGMRPTAGNTAAHTSVEVKPDATTGVAHPEACTCCTDNGHVANDGHLSRDGHLSHDSMRTLQRGEQVPRTRTKGPKNADSGYQECG